MVHVSGFSLKKVVDGVNAAQYYSSRGARFLRLLSVLLLLLPFYFFILFSLFT